MFRPLALAFVLFITAETVSVYRDRRQSCECSPGEEPKCGCQVVPSVEPGKAFQMLCSCSPPSPPKCVCRETTAVPLTPVFPSAPSSMKCVDVCKKSCLDPCSRLSSNGRCDQVCSEACSYSCTKQGKPQESSVVSEYKFVIPTSTRPPIPTLLPLPPVPAFFIGNSITPPSLVLPAPKVCEASCMPECNFACTTFKPALKLITDVVDGKVSNSGSCQQSCGETCVKVCSTTGVALTECANNCGTACTETCGLVHKKTCLPQCMPSCSATCVQIQTEIKVPGAVEPSPAIFPSPDIVTPSSPAVAARCQNECSVQCEHQCGVHSLAGPQCLAACQTTCYPVCQAKLRRHMKPRKNELKPWTYST